MKNRYFTLLLLCFSAAATAQCYQPIDLTDRMDEADAAVIGRVVRSEAFYNAFGEIYTMHTLAIDARADTEPLTLPVDTLKFFTMGGQINDEQLVVYPSLRGISDADGLFLLSRYKGDRVVSDEGILYRPTAVHESYMNFDVTTGNFTDGGNVVGNLEAVNELVRNHIGRPLVALTDRDFAARPVGGRSMMPVVNNISPRFVSAGVGDEITITGSGFGANRGSVFFDSPDDGTGGAFTGTNPADIISWSNTSIRVQVVSEAGGGRVIVRTADGQQVTSPVAIDVNFAVTNLSLNDGQVVTPLLIDDEADGNGGYIFTVSNTNANGGRSLAGDAPALAALTRAVTTWQQDGDYSIYLQGTTSLQQPSRDDGVNIVSYDSDAYDFDVELGSGTVGIAFSYFSACGASEFEVSGIDVLFRRPGNPNGIGGSVNYDFGPGLSGSGTDFESVALHELGHTLQLKHVADPNEVMSFRITNGATQRDISPDTESGANFVFELAAEYEPPVINCGGDFGEERQYQTFSAVNGAALPVTWSGFTATPVGKVVELDWSVAASANNAYFTVERSLDGARFQTLAEVPAVQHAASYASVDEEPGAGVSFYRIAQTDFDGTRSYSEVRRVAFAEAAGISVYPNPVVNELTVAGSAGELTVYDAAGRRVMRQPAATAGRTRVDVSALPTGQYLVRTADGQTTRFVRR